MRVAIHVRPGVRAAGIGGRHGDALIVRVRERAVDGKATEAALLALGSALGVGRQEVELVAGATNRLKVVEVPDSTTGRYLQLRDSAQP